MNVGTAQLEITPKPGVDLAGFAVRPQPSTRVLDPLRVRALHLEKGSEHLLWLHADLLALEQPLADRLRQWVQAELGIVSSRVLVSATHTHSGPATIALTGCGGVDPAYVRWLEEQLRCAARLALRDTESCHLVAAEGQCHLGVDRRRSTSGHTDPRVGALAWRRSDGTFKAVVLNYAMHPVCLRSTLLSADWPGAAAHALSEGLPGGPLALVTVGACGNINPPAVGVEPGQMRDWGRQIAESVRPALAAAGRAPNRLDQESLRVSTAVVPLPLETWSAADIQHYAETCLADPSGHREFGDKFRLAVETWRSTMTNHLRQGRSFCAQVELSAVALGGSVLLGVNAELFSRFSALVNAAAGPRVYTLSCTNGMIGYAPSAEAYAEGGYEVAWSMLFYNMARPKQGGLELLAERARRLIPDMLVSPG